MSNLDWWVWVLAVIGFPFVLLFASKVIGYGLEAGRAKFHKRKG